MKSYTDINQSKILAKILPIESADMYYSKDDTTYAKILTKYEITYANVLYGSCDIRYFNICELIPCWSLAALIDVIKSINENTYTIRGTLDDGATISFDEITNVMFQEKEIIDAVFKMVVWLKEKRYETT